MELAGDEDGVGVGLKGKGGADGDFDGAGAGDSFAGLLQLEQAVDAQGDDGEPEVRGQQADAGAEGRQLAVFGQCAFGKTRTL